MAEDGHVLERVSRLLLSQTNVIKSNEINGVLSKELQKQEFICDHFSLLKSGKGLTRCHLADWCIPKQFTDNLIPLR